MENIYSYNASGVIKCSSNLHHFKALCYKLASGKKEEKNTLKRKQTPPSISPSASLYVSFIPLSIAPVDPCTLSFLQFSPPPVLSLSFLPASSFISHLSGKLLQDSVGHRGKVGLKEAEMGLKLSCPLLCPEQ